MPKAQRSFCTLPPSVCSGLLAVYFALLPVAAVGQALHHDPVAAVGLAAPVTMFALSGLLVIRSRRQFRNIADLAGRC